MPDELLQFHRQHGAFFSSDQEGSNPLHYGKSDLDYVRIREHVGLIDLSSRSRLVLVGADRAKFLHGQVTNNVQNLQPGSGCHAGLVTAKGKIQTDLFIYNLGEELLLDFETGLAGAITARLDRYIIADDVQIVDAAPHYGLWSWQGPQAAAVAAALDWGVPPATPFAFVKRTVPEWGDAEVYWMNQPRLGLPGFELYVPAAAMVQAGEHLLKLCQSVGGGLVGTEAFNWVRVEQGIPRYGIDMDENNLAPESGLETRAISYSKGCYIGQEVIARIRTYGQVAKALRGLRFDPVNTTQVLPVKGDKLVEGDKEIGYVTSAIFSPTLRTNVALAYVRREFNKVGRHVTVQCSDGTLLGATVHSLPFEPIV